MVVALAVCRGYCDVSDHVLTLFYTSLREKNSFELPSPRAASAVCMQNKEGLPSSFSTFVHGLDGKPACGRLAVTGECGEGFAFGSVAVVVVVASSVM